ncbi:MAG: PEGA domain-containing protein, partial [Prevotella sp.]|nr:PEGA domain-containing protein [Prevotella sp.]
MKKYLLSILLAFVTAGVGAQNIKVTKFGRLERDMTANTHGTQKLDQNGEKAALIKIQAPDRGFTFNGGSLGIVASEEHDGEIWLYVPRRAKRLTIQHKDYGVLREYFYPVPIDGARTYEMYLDIGIGRYVTINAERANSTIYIDGERVGQSPINHKYLNYGRHTVRALKDRYEGETSFIITTEDDPGLRLINVEQRDMSDHFGDVTVNVENKAEIWFEGKNVGNGSWQTQLREGSYTVETRKVDCDPEKTSFTVVAKTNNVVQAAPPTPHTGRLSLYTRPRNAVATINGTDPIDLTESHTLPIGTYQINLSRKGYVSKSGLEYKVNHNQTTR